MRDATSRGAVARPCEILCLVKEPRTNANRGDKFVDFYEGGKCVPPLKASIKTDFFFSFRSRKGKHPSSLRVGRTLLILFLSDCCDGYPSTSSIAFPHNRSIILLPPSLLCNQS